MMGSKNHCWVLASVQGSRVMRPSDSVRTIPGKPESSIYFGVGALYVEPVQHRTGRVMLRHSEPSMLWCARVAGGVRFLWGAMAAVGVLVPHYGHPCGLAIRHFTWWGGGSSIS